MFNDSQKCYPPFCGINSKVGAMPSSMHFKSYVLYPPLNDVAIRAISGAMLNGLYLDQPIPPDKYADVVRGSEIGVNIVPDRPIIKMARREYVDSFFIDGSLKLGTFSDFNRYDHEEIGDTAEGRFLLVGQNQSATAFAELGGGFDQLAFCCYAGDPDQNCIDRFGYDAAYRINKPVEFARAIMSCVGAIGVSYASCIYSKHKAVVSVIPQDFNFSVISPHLLDLAGIAKFFVKPAAYSHQCEFRFLWQMPNDIDLPVVIKCREAIRFCERVAIGA